LLVLGRKFGEYVIIDGNIKVQVVRSDDDDLRLAIDAPKHIFIVRGETLEKRSENKTTED
jgi:carbon storage regulator